MIFKNNICIIPLIALILNCWSPTIYTAPTTTDKVKEFAKSQEFILGAFTLFCIAGGTAIWYVHCRNPKKEPHSDIQNENVGSTNLTITDPKLSLNNFDLTSILSLLSKEKLAEDPAFIGWEVTAKGFSLSENTPAFIKDSSRWKKAGWAGFWTIHDHDKVITIKAKYTTEARVHQFLKDIHQWHQQSPYKEYSTSYIPDIPLS
jgi:hypothetical protein